jgi:hypothetical protein
LALVITENSIVFKTENDRIFLSLV